MANPGDTGNGATITFGTSALSLAVTEIQIGETTIDMLDVSTLATTGYFKRMAADLKSAGDITVSFLHITQTAAPGVGGTPETFTVTFPQQAGDSAAATLVGTVVITGWTPPTLKNNEVQMGQVKVSFDGDTGPTYTKATSS